MASPQLCNDIRQSFISKVEKIRARFSLAPPCATSKAKTTPEKLQKFRLVSEEEIRAIISKLKPTSYPDDPCPAWFIQKHVDTLVIDICRVINLSLRLGIVPSRFKRAIILPLLKKVCLEPTILTNYRPISLLPFLSKVLEQVVFTQLQEQFESHGLFHDCQSGFRPGRGTEMSALDMRERLLGVRDVGGPQPWCCWTSLRRLTPLTILSCSLECNPYLAVRTQC